MNRREGFWQPVVVEGRSTFCKHCKVHGHEVMNCHKLAKKKKNANWARKQDNMKTNVPYFKPSSAQPTWIIKNKKDDDSSTSLQNTGETTTYNEVSISSEKAPNEAPSQETNILNQDGGEPPDLQDGTLSSGCSKAMQAGAYSLKYGENSEVLVTEKDSQQFWFRDDSITMQQTSTNKLIRNKSVPNLSQMDQSNYYNLDDEVILCHHDMKQSNNISSYPTKAAGQGPLNNYNVDDESSFLEY